MEKKSLNFLGTLNPKLLYMLKICQSPLNYTEQKYISEGILKEIGNLLKNHRFSEKGIIINFQKSDNLEINIKDRHCKLKIKENKKPGKKYFCEEGDNNISNYTVGQIELFPKNGDSYIFPPSIETFKCEKKEKCNICNGSGLCTKCLGEKKVICYNCQGKNICQDCKGLGQITCDVCEGYKLCHNCEGNGKIICEKCDGEGSCSDCEGSGLYPCLSCNQTGDCPRCDGTGTLYCSDCYGKGAKKCNVCNGNGKAFEEETCRDCNGSGNYPKRNFEYVTCRRCKGSGFYRRYIGSCQYCDGTGKEYCWNCSGEGTVDCDRCNGEGQCLKCNGNGHIRCKACKGDGKCKKCRGKGNIKCQECAGSGKCYNCKGVGKIKCYTCKGNGKCLVCDDEGKIDCQECKGNGTCENCNGTGFIKCGNCNGSGFYQTFKTIKIDKINIQSTYDDLDNIIFEKKDKSNKYEILNNYLLYKIDSLEIINNENIIHEKFKNLSVNQNVLNFLEDYKNKFLKKKENPIIPNLESVETIIDIYNIVMFKMVIRYSNKIFDFYIMEKNGLVYFENKPSHWDNFKSFFI